MQIKKTRPSLSRPCATLMLDMRAFLDHGREGYPLSEALEDAYTWLLMDEAVSRPGQVIFSQPRTWQ